MLQLTHSSIKQKPDSDCWEIDPEIEFVTFSPVSEQHKNIPPYTMCICVLNKNILAWTKNGQEDEIHFYSREYYTKRN